MPIPTFARSFTNTSRSAAMTLALISLACSGDDASDTAAGGAGGGAGATSGGSTSSGASAGDTGSGGTDGGGSGAATAGGTSAGGTSAGAGGTAGVDSEGTSSGGTDSGGTNAGGTAPGGGGSGGAPDTCGDSDCEGSESCATCTADCGACTPSTPSGLFVTAAELDRAKQRIQSGASPWASLGGSTKARADAALSMVADPFHMDDVMAITFGWCEAEDYAVYDTLKDATRKFEDDSDPIRSLGLQYAFSGDTQYADKAVALMLDYAAAQTIVNLHDLSVNYEDATLLGQPNNNVYCSDMPWNFALDTMWQTYGLINVADTYLLLTRNGYALSPGDDDVLRDWILRLVEAVNSSFHAWTKWADAHPTSSSYEYYRSDNHLFWSMAGILAGAAALGDTTLASYVIDGGSFTDSRSGAYANPSYAYEVIEQAIDPSGVVFEETVPRDPPIGYSFFHLWPMVLVAEIAAVHFDTPELWDYEAPSGGSIRKALTRYADYILGTATSPDPGAEPDFETLYGWLYEPAVSRWNDPKHVTVLESVPRDGWILQSVGPSALLLGPDL